MKRSHTLITVLLALLVLAPVFAAPRARVSARDISLVPAASWIVRKGNLPGGALVAIVAPRPDGDFTANVNVVTENVPKGLSIERYYAANKQTIEKMGGKIVSETLMQIGPRTAGRLIWTATMEGRALKFHSTFFVYGTLGYVITGTAVPARYSAYALDFERMADSARFTK